MEHKKEVSPSIETKVAEQKTESDEKKDQTQVKMPEKRLSPTLLLQQILDTLNKLDSKVMVLMGKVDTLEKEIAAIKNDKIQNTLQSLTAALLADLANKFSVGQQTPGVTPATQPIHQIPQAQQVPKREEPAIEEEGLIKPSKIFKRT
ncbi:MAG: hypothetical protein ACP6IS_04820 [Candidatus Asgardarchaeia archaeon]